MSQNIDQPVIPIGVRIISSMFLIFIPIFSLLYWLMIIIKWLFAPIMLGINIFLVIPCGKFFVKMPHTLKTLPIDESSLPNSIWKHFKEVSLELAREGFVVGDYVKIKNLSPNLKSFFMSMVLPRTGQAVGVIVSVPLKADLSIMELPEEATCSLEFTTYYEENTIVDFIIYSDPEPFPFLKSRQRLFVEELSSRGLFQLFDQFEKSIDGKIPASLFTKLSNNPETVVKSEYLMLVNHALKQGFLKKRSSHYVMTWKGAVTNGLRTVWPSSEWFIHKEQQKLKTVLNTAGLEYEDIWDFEPDDSKSGQLDESLLLLKFPRNYSPL